MSGMKPLAIYLSVFVVSLALRAVAPAQTGARSENDAPQLETLAKKIDEQNTKIDALSQQILKLEQSISNIRPGVMIGETTPTPAAASAVPVASPVGGQGGNAHVVAKGETLTSIAKTHKVSVTELQKFNHIENDRALQIGQTIMVPSPGSSSPSPPASPAAPNE